MSRRYVYGMVMYVIAFVPALANVTASLVLIVILALLFILPEPGAKRVGSTTRPGR
jgi:hypothetical protein